MVQPRFEVIGTGNAYQIRDNVKKCLYEPRSPEGGLSITDAGKLLRGAIDIIQKSGDVADLSQVEIGNDGVHIGDRFIRREEIEGFDQAYTEIDSSFSPVVDRTSTFARREIPDNAEQTGASPRAASGEDVGGPSDLGDRDVSHLPDAVTPPAARSALSSIARFFRRIRWPDFIVKIAEVFEKIFAKDHFVARHRARAQEYNAPTDDKIAAVREFEVLPAGDHLHAHVPESIRLERDQSDYRPVDHKEQGRVAIERGEVRAVAPLESGHGTLKHTVTAYDVRSGTAEPDAVVPTATRFHQHSATVGNHLVNCYMTQKDGAGILRTGVINTPEKAAEFRAAAQELHRQMGRRGKVRIVSHQLNSPEPEGKMIRKQHQYLLQQCDDDFEIAHLNAPCNRYYHVTRAHGGKPIASAFLTGEKQSHEMNVEGMTQYLGWILEDAPEELKTKLNQKGASKILAKQKEVNQKFSEIVDLEKRISETEDKDVQKDLKAQIKTKLQEIDTLRNQMIWGKPGEFSGLREMHKYLKEVWEQDNVEHPMRDRMIIFRKLLGNQLEIEGAELERNQEHLLFFALDKELGVITAMNCKSGLDRTGFLFALFLGAMDLPEEKMLKIALNWESYSLELNQLYRKNNYDPKAVWNELDPKYHRDGEELRYIFEMQQNVLQHLLKVSLPITGISTGLVGLKWGKGMTANLLPLYCIPPVVKTGDPERTIQLLTYSKSGKPQGLTAEGHRLMTQLSPHRGA